MTPEREQEIRRLRGERPRNRFGRASAAVLLGLVVLVWTGGSFEVSGLLTEQRLANLHRFVEELKPHPLQGEAWDWGVALRWAAGVMADKGSEGASRTLAISVVAIVLAALWGLAACLPATRTLASPEPFLARPRPPARWRRLIWRGVVAVCRAQLVFLRSLPEYVWAFLLIAMIGPTAWPAILALAIHNAGILGKLDGEVIENLPPASLAALRGVGASRGQIVVAGVLPVIVPRFLLFFFYRWESCVREATVLGMLGIASLGFWIQDARARTHIDEMFFLVLVGSLIVLVGDVVSLVAREAVRRSA